MENTLPPIEDNDFMQEHPQPPPTPPQQVEPMYVPYMYQPPPTPEKRDIFSDLEKTHYIIFFIVFILGFFMGKTMQPVIVKNL